MMVELTIDNQSVQVPEGTTVLQAAQKLGIAIPTMCHKAGFQPSTSCMVCVVDIEGFEALMPSCGTPAEAGMVIKTATEKVQQARRAALELLLSDHIGDCEGPCRLGCPANMNIPQMLRQIATGKLREAIETIKQDIPLPAVLGRICPAPCEKVCRRAHQDSAVSICLLKRFVADVDLKTSAPYKPDCLPSTGKKAAIVGAGPCGVSAAYYLAQRGHSCTLFDRNDQAGGMLRCDEIKEILPEEVLDQEIDLILDLGMEFKGGMTMGRDFSLKDLQRDFDVVFLALGESAHRDPLRLPLEMQEEKIQTHRNTYQTSAEGVFAGGGAIGSRRLCVKAVADGKEAAAAMDQFLCGQAVIGVLKKFNSRLGSLTDEEWTEFVGEADPQDRLESVDRHTGCTAEQAGKEARRCLHCDCRKKKNCRLRQLSSELKVPSGTYKGLRRPFARKNKHPEVVFEPGKCIQCGLCIQILKRNERSKALTFRDRGFKVQLSAALDESIEDTVGPAARECVEICPTGAWAMKNDPK